MRIIEETLDDTTLVQQAIGFTPPFTITLESDTAGRKISISTDNEAHYFDLVPDLSQATALVYTILAPITHLKATGESGDKISVLFGDK